VRPVGSNEMFEVDVRIIFASKVDLLSMCREGRMLEDFYYRINDFPLTIPPLRERVDDIELLANHYLKIFADRMKKRILGFSDESIAFLKACEWPGNVRELEKIVKRAVILTDDNCAVMPSELVFDLSNAGSIEKTEGISLPDKIRELERKSISSALEKNSWNRKLTAAELGISYPTLLKKIREYDLSSSRE